MKKKWLAWLLAVCCTLSVGLAACEDGGNVSSVESASSAAESTADSSSSEDSSSEDSSSEDSSSEDSSSEDSSSSSEGEGEGEEPTEGLEYTLSYDETYYIVTGIGGEKGDTIVIPATHNGLPVKEIRHGAFFACRSIKKVIISEGVESIGFSAFDSCGNLESAIMPDSMKTIGDSAFSFAGLRELTIPSGVVSIGALAFSSCDNLISVYIPENVTSIMGGAFGSSDNLTSIEVSERNEHYQSIDGALYTKDGKTLVQYPAGKEGETYTISAGVTTIDNWAFYESKSLTEMNIPEGVVSVGDRAFSNCYNLQSVRIPASVASFGEAPFGYTDLTNVEVAAGNANYQSIDGNVYSKDGKTFIQYAVGKTATEFTLPSHVTTIDRFAFYTSDLKSIVLPEGVTTIKGWAFCYCESLESITIPDSVTAIERYALTDNGKLTSVTFQTTAGWSVDETYDNSNPQNISATDLADKAKAAEYLKETYRAYDWTRN